MTKSSYFERRVHSLVKKILVFLAAVIILSAVPAFAAGTKPAPKATPKAAAAPAGVMATVNGEKITKEDLAKTAFDWDASMVLERMIMYKIMDQEAKKAGVVVAQKDVDAKFAELKKNLPPGQDFKELLKRNGMTPASASAYMKMNLQVEKIIRKGIKVNPNDLTGYNKSEHILIRVASTADPKDKEKNEADAKAKIEKIAAEIKGGLSFEEAAKKYSEDPMSKDKGGDLGFRGPGELMPEFETAAKALKAGQVSDPVKTSYGYHLIKLIANGKDATGEDRKKLEDQLVSKQMGEKWQEFMLQSRNRAKVVNYLDPEKPKPAPKPAQAPKPAPQPAQTTPPAGEGTPPPPPPPPANP